MSGSSVIPGTLNAPTESNSPGFSERLTADVSIGIFNERYRLQKRRIISDDSELSVDLPR